MGLMTEDVGRVHVEDSSSSSPGAAHTALDSTPKMLVPPAAWVVSPSGVDTGVVGMDMSLSASVSAELDTGCPHLLAEAGFPPHLSSCYPQAWLSSPSASVLVKMTR